MRLYALLALLAATAAQAAPLATVTASCDSAIAAAERRTATAPGLLHAIGLVESGRADPKTAERRPWPWTVTAEGVGTFYPTKADAIAAVQALRTRGIASIDVGCMQVNLLHHPAAFRTLDDAFDPAVNTTYAARFLSDLHARLGDWSAAAAAYHSQNPAVAAPYARLIAAIWSGAPLPVTEQPGGQETIRFLTGATLRIVHDATRPGRITGVLN